MLSLVYYICTVAASILGGEDPNIQTASCTQDPGPKPKSNDSCSVCFREFKIGTSFWLICTVAASISGGEDPNIQTASCTQDPGPKPQYIYIYIYIYYMQKSYYRQSFSP